jgi:predicted Zn finger-like uncharacterized protein
MKTQCPNCKSKFNVNETNIGKQAKCPKCAKPFTIEPFIETPVAAVPPVKSPQPAPPPVKTAPPVDAPVPAAPPVKSPEPPPAPAKIATPAEPASKAPNFMLGVNPQDKCAASLTGPGGLPVSAVESIPKPKSKASSKLLFVYCWMIVRIIAGVLGAMGLMMAIKKGAHSTLIATFAAADVFLVCSVLIELLLFYKMWDAIRDRQTSITPGKAVGFLFIPVFNLYWALCMVIGFAEDYNSYILRRSIKVKDLPLTPFFIYAFMLMLNILFVTTPMLCVFAVVNRINGAFNNYTEAFWAILAFVIAAGIGHFITYILFAFKTCNAVNSLPDALVKSR